MKQLKQIIFLLFLLGNPVVINAQFIITGKLMQSTNAPIIWAEIIILTPQNEAITSQLTNEQGDFKIILSEGNYTIQIKQLGNLLIEKDIQVNQNINLGVLYPEMTKKLEEISITSQKKIIERKVDRVIFNVQNSARASNGDALEALKVTPGIRVQNDVVTMIGKGGMGLMIDDRLMALSGEDLTNYLKTIAADNIKSIEVITTPPAKYSAEGNSGLINIVLKKAKKDTWNTSIRTNLKQNTYFTGGLGGIFTYKKDKNSCVVSTLYTNGSNQGIENSTIYYPNQQWQNNGLGRYYTNIWSNRLGYDYQINKKWSLGLQYVGNINKPNIDDSNKVNLIDNTTQKQIGNINSKGESKREKELNTFNLHSNIDLDTIGRKISMDVDYLLYKSNVTRNFDATIFALPQSGLQSGIQKTLNHTNQTIKNISTQFDIQHPLRWMNLNYGIRFSFSKTQNTVDLFDASTGQLIWDPNQSNKFDFKENTQAIYINGNKTFGKEKWQTQVGLRVENTQTEGKSITLNQITSINYIQFFPTVYCMYKVNDNKTISISYSKRIYRPNFSNLNPFRWYTSNFSYSEGNPNLRPCISNNFELNFNYKDHISSSLFFSKETNNFGQVVMLNTNEYIQRITQLNYFDNYSIGLNQMINYTKKRWWENQNSLYVYFQHSDSKIYPLTPKTNEGLGAQINTSNNFILKKDKTLSAGFDVSYIFPNKSGDLVYNYERTLISLYGRASFLEKKLQATITVENILKTNDFNTLSTRNTIDTRYKGYYDSRYINVQLIYKFGNTKVSIKNRKVSNEEEKNRTN
ncbi:TonB-dependent receptor [Flavobacterium columnare]|uniref:TonB-dependent outer membrane receptorprecursor n=1 Tax=Flavobacterium columnare (strain ATCC 49512 / CIP 103533 / TG 44/87) TaxID=1041826 RepID=G8X980_FLACA|nr:outer membrane beta-barrel protein [Flavobacterium columnare]AEW85131.1 TonB-dependent outer membrane receptorprecursor [Flavobacterium columnare ATCC 49512]MBF6653428.1 TonB-dependent receptor [Flavobacterium columnare]